MPASLPERNLHRVVWSAGALLGMLALVGLLRLGGGWTPPSSPPLPSSYAAQPLPADYVPVSGEQSVREVSVLGVWARIAAVMIAAYGLLLGVRWWKARSEQGQGLLASSAGSGERTMQVKESLRVGAGWDLHLLQVGEYLLVVGSNAAQMILLGRLPSRSPAPERSELTDEGSEPERTEPQPDHEPRLLAKVAGLREREWEQRRADLIDALRQQVVE